MSAIRSSKSSILIIDDDKPFLKHTEDILLSNLSDKVITCNDHKKVLPLLDDQAIAVVLLNINIQKESGWSLLPAIYETCPDTPVLVVSETNTVETAVNCMQLGAFDYLVKPVGDARLVGSVRRALELRYIQLENTLLRRYLLSGKLEHPEAFEELITGNHQMRSLFQYLEAVAETALPILITGETGTGKELFAHAIHIISKRSGECVAVNVAGVDDQLFSDTLFGHLKGAFTGAVQDRKGLIELAAGGTLFLDEIGDLKPESQVKLLRLLQEGEYLPLGADTPRSTDARIVVATNRDIEAMQANETFRKDLYYRLKAHQIHIPPLRDRREDIPLLMNHFLAKAASVLEKRKPTAPRELSTLLMTYHFPGNVRELEGMIFDAVSQHKSGVLSMDTFRQVITPKSVSGPSPESTDTNQIQGSAQFGYPLPTIKECEELLIMEALNRSENNQTIAARMLGISRRALNNRLQRSKPK